MHDRAPRYFHLPCKKKICIHTSNLHLNLNLNPGNMHSYLQMYFFIVAMFVNLVAFIKQPVLCNTINAALFVLFVLFGQEPLKERIIIFLTWIIFSIITIFGEAVIIHISGALQYTNQDFMNTSSWLFVAYSLMIMNIVLTYKLLHKFL